MNKKFPYGASYYPLIEKRESWERDLKVMMETGINYIRTAEIVNGWDQLEPSEGDFRFDELEEFFDLASKYGIKILLGTGSNSAPIWLEKKDPDVNIVSNTGAKFPTNVTYGWACYNNPSFIEASTNYITALVNRFKNHKSLYAYQINNEIGYPFMPLDAAGLQLYCYCNSCKSKFRTWVQNKYETLDNLNHAYRWSTTNQYHLSFNDVVPPKAKPTSWASVTRWLDWRLFQMEQITNQVKRENDLIKSLDSIHLTTTNIFYMKSQDPLGVITALNQFEIAKIPDIVGYDLYPGSGNKLETKPEFSSMCLDHARSITKPINKDYWLAEAEGGPIGGWILGPDRNSNGIDIKRNILEAVAHGSKATLYQLFKELEFQPLHWGGVMNLDGSKNKRTFAAQEIGDFLRDKSKFILNSKTKKGQVALLVSKENEIIMNGVGHETFYLDELRGVYKHYWSKGYQVDFIRREHLGDYAKSYEIIHAPFLAVVDKETIDGIEEYVANGGTFIGSARLSYMTSEGWYRYPIFGNILGSVLGIKMGEVEAHVNPVIYYKDKIVNGYWHQEDITLQGAQQVAKFENGYPAVTINKYKKGIAIYFATHIGNDVVNGNNNIMEEILNDLVTIDPMVEINYPKKFGKELDAHLLETDTEKMMIVTQYYSKSREDFVPEEFTVNFKVKGTDISRINEYYTNKNIDFTIEGNYIVFDLIVSKNEFIILEMTRVKS